MHYIPSFSHVSLNQGHGVSFETPWTLVDLIDKRVSARSQSNTEVPRLYLAFSAVHSRLDYHKFASVPQYCYRRLRINFQKRANSKVRQKIIQERRNNPWEHFLNFFYTLYLNVRNKALLEMLTLSQLVKKFTSPPFIARNPKFPSCVSKVQSPAHILSQINPVHTLPFNLLKICFNNFIIVAIIIFIILSPTYPYVSMWSLSLESPTKSCIHVSSPHTCYMSRPSRNIRIILGEQ